NSRSTQQWKNVPRGTMDEVSSQVRLNLPFKLTTRPPLRLFHLVLESHDGRALVPIPKRSTSPRGDVDIAVADSLKVLDLKRPIREADLSRAFSAARARSATPLIWIKLVANDSQRPTTLPDEGSHVLVSGVQQCRFSRLRLWRASCNCMDQTRVFEA